MKVLSKKRKTLCFLEKLDDKKILNVIEQFVHVSMLFKMLSHTAK